MARDIATLATDIMGYAASHPEFGLQDFDAEVRGRSSEQHKIAQYEGGIENTKQAISMARMNPKAVLSGEKPRLIDEWQKAPDIWNQVKDDLDFEYQFGKYILTGSSTPADKTEVHHSGAGRITPLNMRPMTLWESKESKGTVSLKDLFDGGNNFPWDMNAEFSLEDVAFLLCRGGGLYRYWHQEILQLK